MRIDIRILDSVCLVGLLAIALGGGMLGTRIADARAASVTLQNEAVDAKVAELKQARSVLSVIDRALTVNQAELENLRKRLPESRDIGEFLAGLDNLMDKHDVSLSSVMPGTPEPQELSIRTPLTFDCQGTFENLHAVLYGLVRMEQLVQVEQVSISRETLSGNCSMNASCGVYGR